MAQCGTDRQVGRWIFSLPSFVNISPATWCVGSLFSLCIFGNNPLPFALRFRLSVITTSSFSLEFRIRACSFYRHVGYESAWSSCTRLRIFFLEQWRTLHPVAFLQHVSNRTYFRLYGKFAHSILTFHAQSHGFGDRGLMAILEACCC